MLVELDVNFGEFRPCDEFTRGTVDGLLRYPKRPFVLPLGPKEVTLDVQ